MSDPALIFRILLLLGVADGAPVVATRLLGERYAWPLDGGLKLWDGRRVFGDSKTLRGLIVSILSTGMAAPLLEISFATGVVMAAASMAGDLSSSFLKRRFGLDIHAQAFGLDQIPEALLPLLILRQALALTALDIAAIVVLFIFCEVVFSVLLFKLRIREQPY